MTLDSVTVQLAPVWTGKVTDPPFVTFWLGDVIAGLQLALMAKLSAPSDGAPCVPTTDLRT